MPKTLLAFSVLVVSGSLLAGNSLLAAPADKPSPSPATIPAASPSPAASAPAAASPTVTPKPDKTPKPPKPSKDPAPAKPSALETDGTGWIDLLPEPDLHGWKRVAYADKPLNPKVSNPWSRVGGTDLLHCAKADTVEMFLNEQTFGDGVFHVEWHFTKAKGKDYNSGVFVRTLADGKVWHQAQVGGVKNIGFLFGNTLKGGKIVPFRVDDKLPLRGNPPDEWNTYEITCKGKDVTLWVNGAVTASWHDCEVPRGMVGLEAEGYEIEFRNLKFKEIK